MQTPAQAGSHGPSPDPGTPPYVPIRHVRWATRKTPRWLIAAGVLFVVAAVLVGIAVHPSRSQRATDLNGFLADMKTGIESCAGGVSESLTVLHAIETGASYDLHTAIGVATYGASNCSPANSMPLDDLATYQVQESLSRFGLSRVVNGLITWAFPDAQRVMYDVAAVLRSRGAARAAAIAHLDRDLRVLNGQRSYLDKIMNTAIAATAATGRPPYLPG
jgi:hypothetical protein